MTNIPLFTITDPKQTRLLCAALDSDYCINYALNYDDSGRPVNTDAVLNIEHEDVYKLLEAYKQIE